MFKDSWSQDAYGIFAEMGTGKSAVVIHTATALWDEAEISGVLVVAPKGTYRNWAREFEIHQPDDVKREVSVWSASARKEDRILLARSLTNERPPLRILKVLLMNVEAFSTAKGTTHAKQFLAAHQSLMVVDESTTIKTPTAKRTKALIKLGRMANYRRILTGSPITKSPLDLYAQAAFLNPKLLGFSSYYTFRNRYAKLKDMHSHGRAYKTVVGYKNLNELQNKIQSWSSRVLKEECLDLPEKIYMTRDVELTKEQREAYRTMRANAVAILRDKVVTAPQVITQILRLHQICCGHLTVHDTVESLPHHRTQALLEVLSETQGSAIIWATYRHDIQAVADALAKEFGADSVVTYYGSTSDEDREDAIERFQSGDARFFVANPKTGGYGLTLTAATTVVYYSNDYNLETRLQSEDRAHRIGQTKPVTYVDLVCRETVDEKILEALREKLNLSREVLGDAWTEWI